MSDAVNHPAHYTSHVSGTECIDFTKKMDFLLGNAFKFTKQGSVTLSFTACRDMLPDPAFYADCLQESFEELRAAAAAASKPAPKPRKKASKKAKAKVQPKKARR